MYFFGFKSETTNFQETYHEVHNDIQSEFHSIRKPPAKYQSWTAVLYYFLVPVSQSNR